jgi:hypothetical protein
LSWAVFGRNLRNCEKRERKKERKKERKEKRRKEEKRKEERKERKKKRKKISNKQRKKNLYCFHLALDEHIMNFELGRPAEHGMNR